MGFSVGAGHLIPCYCPESKKQTDGTRRRKLRANPDVEGKFSKNNYSLNIPYLTSNQRSGSCSIGELPTRVNHSCLFCDHSLNIVWCFRRAVERRAAGVATCGTSTLPKAGSLSSDCASTLHSLMKAQREVAAGSGMDGAAATSFAITDCLRTSVNL